MWFQSARFLDVRERAKLAPRRFKVDSQSGHISDTSRRLCCNGYLFMSAQKDGKVVTIVIKSSIHSLGRGFQNAHCWNLSETYTAGRKLCIHVHVFCGPLYSSHVTHWIQYCITTSETVQGVFDYWRLNVTERAKIWVFLCLVLITFASIHLLTRERSCSFLGKKQWIKGRLAPRPCLVAHCYDTWAKVFHSSRL